MEERGVTGGMRMRGGQKGAEGVDLGGGGGGG